MSPFGVELGLLTAACMVKSKAMMGKGFGRYKETDTA